MSDFLPFALPDIREEEINEVVSCLRSGWITTGPKTKQFEEDFAKFVGAKYALAVNSATAGLHLALDAIGIKRGDKVIVPDYTFTATAEVVRYFDADPVFCDIDPKTYTMDVSCLQELLKRHKDIKAIMPVHIAGLSCDMDPILKLAREFGALIVEDAAHALPSYYKNKIIGSIGDLTVFSFYATKTLATGEGGMIVTNNDEYKKRINVMRLHGFSRDAWDRYTSTKASWYYEIIAPGYKYNMTDIAAAMGIHQLKKVNEFFHKRSQIAKKYDEAFKNIAGLTLPSSPGSDYVHAYHLYMIRVNPKIRNQFIDKMKEKGVGCSVHFIPLHLHPYWKERYNLKESDFPNAQKNFEQSVSLPIYTKMTEGDVQKVITAVKETIKELS